MFYLQKAVLSSILVLLLILPCFAKERKAVQKKERKAVQKKEDTYLLKYKFKKDDALKYKLKSTIKGSFIHGDTPSLPFEATLDILLLSRVLNVSDDGVIALQMTPLEVTPNIKGLGLLRLPEEFKAVSYIMNFTDRGRTLKTVGLSEFPMDSDIAVTLRMIAEASPYVELVFPSNPVKVGDSWELNVIKDEKIPVKVKYFFEGIEKIKGEKCAKISSIFSFPFSSLNIIPGGDYNPIRGIVNATGKYYFSIDRGIVVKYEIDGDLKINALLTSVVQGKYDTKILNVNAKGSMIIELQE